MHLQAICCVPIAPLRKSPAHEAEMTNQVLFGETVHITAIQDGLWIKVQAMYDGYEGWCQQSHFEQITTAYEQPTLLANGWVNKVLVDHIPMQVPYGCPLSGFENGIATWGRHTLEFGGETWNPAAAVKDKATIMALANQFINTAYLWGGRSVFGVDCSGFTQTVFRFLNTALPRDAHQQALQGSAVDFLQEVRCGDLAFFDNEDGQIIHVGLLLGEQEIVHAAGKVRIDKIDHAGIVHMQTGEHTHRLRIIKRFW